MGYEKDRLTGETVEERDRQDYQAQIANLEEYKRIRAGLPRVEIITEAEFITPKSTLDQNTSFSAANVVDYVKVLTPNSALHIALVREQIKVAIGLDEPREVVQDLKKQAA